ncbi:hypothetical protein AZH53_10870 [Methanomicrobiaceae archaeon CYW5]|nr:hypothetical protein [Methanovulcanius yangii]
MNDEGQLYTIEGITAGIIMLLTAYVVFSTGFVFTPGDAHIADMQLQQLGYDALLVMDTPGSIEDDKSRLQELIMTNDQAAFKDEFNMLLQKGTGTTYMDDPAGFIIDERTQWNATIYYRDTDHDNLLHSYAFGNSTRGGEFVTREPEISVTRYVHLSGEPSYLPVDVRNIMDNREQMVLLEVLLWRA